jgi:hypothetical protein
MSQEQSFESHAYRPTATIVASVLWLLAAAAFVATIAFGWNLRDVAIGWLMASVLVLISISRMYTTRLQDRIILLEMKVRCAEVLPAGADAKLAELGPKHVAALRFASDDELGALLDRAVREKLVPADIKRAIKRWRPDRLRT